jgi:hypothetical protein
MTSDDRDDATVASLARLPALAPDPARADRTRQRCRALLTRQQSLREPLLPRFPAARPRLAAVTVAAFCLLSIVYVGALVATVVRLRDLFR